jgi:hypothetical protein
VAVDFKEESLMHQVAVVIDDDALIMLERDGNRDRVRKILYDRVQSVLIWRKFPWLRAIIIGVFLLLLTLSFMPLAINSRNLAAKIPFVLCLITLLVVELRYLYYKRTYLQIFRAGESKLFKLIISPGKVKSIVNRLVENINKTQTSLISKT